MVRRRVRDKEDMENWFSSGLCLSSRLFFESVSRFLGQGTLNQMLSLSLSPPCSSFLFLLLPFSPPFSLTVTYSLLYVRNDMGH